jgi:uncharacterized membrane protein YuzA (DUF378 family)
MLAGRLYILCIVIVLLVSLNLGIVGGFEVNLLKHLTFNNITVLRIIYIISGLCALYLLLFKPRQVFLSFLEKTVMPPSIFKPYEQINTNTSLTIDAPHAIKVVYWAAEKDSGHIEENPQDAYKDFDNVGVVNVVNNKATLKFNCPESYKVGRSLMRNTLTPHVHYRLIYRSGIISEIFTLKINKC